MSGAGAPDGGHVRSPACPDGQTVRTALRLAARAPSVRNAQPWRWQTGEASLELFAEPDPASAARTERDTILSCGVALHHAAVALAALGWRPRVHRFPDAPAAGRLAVIELCAHGSEPEQVDVALAAAIPRRRTDRRGYSEWRVPTADIALMGARAARSGVMLRQVDDLDELTAAAALAIGLPPAADRGVLLVLGTEADDRLAWLRSGEATSVVLLTATALGLASCSIIEPLEFAETRAAVGRDVFGARGFPQLLVRVGWAAVDADPLPATPRRRPGEVLDRAAVDDRDEACV